jgi:hypothetical protein
MLDLKKWTLPLLSAFAVVLLLTRIVIAFIEPSYSFVDDLIYVGSAIHMVLGEQCAPAAGNFCNYEHPPLAKLLIALGFEIFGRTQLVGNLPGIGINQLGGRIFQIIMASFMAPITYLVVNKMSGNWGMAFLAGLFVLVDPLLFSLSLTAGIDVAMVFFAELALLPYVYESHFGKMNSFYLTGFVLGLSLLSKETAVFIILAIISYNLLLGDGNTRARLLSSVEIVAGAVVVFIVGLQLYDSLLTPFPTFLNQLQTMASFHLSASTSQLSYLTGGSNCTQYAGLCPTDKSLVPHFLYSGLPVAFVQYAVCGSCWTGTNPFDWLFYVPPVAFPTALVLAVNYPLVWMTFVWAPLGAYRWLKGRIDQDLRPVLLSLSIFLWNLASNLVIFSALERAVFEWYILPVVPAFAIGGAYLLTRPLTPRWLLYLGTALVIGVGLLLSPVVYHILYPQPQYSSS